MCSFLAINLLNKLNKLIVFGTVIISLLIFLSGILDLFSFVYFYGSTKGNCGRLLTLTEEKRLIDN